MKKLIMLLLTVLLGKTVFSQEKTLFLNIDRGFSQTEKGPPHTLHFQVEKINEISTSLGDSITLSYRVSSVNIDLLNVRVIEENYLSSYSTCLMSSFKILKRDFEIPGNSVGEIHFPKNKKNITVKLILSFTVKSARSVQQILSIEFKLNSDGHCSEIKKTYNPA
jgi:hypothetical protein